MQQGYIFRCHEFLQCFFGVSPCSGTSWFPEYSSKISKSNIRGLWGQVFHLSKSILASPDPICSNYASRIFIFQVNVKRATSSPAFEYPTVLHNTSSGSPVFIAFFTVSAMRFPSLQTNVVRSLALATNSPEQSPTMMETEGSSL